MEKGSGAMEYCMGSEERAEAAAAEESRTEPDWGWPKLRELRGRKKG